MSAMVNNPTVTLPGSGILGRAFADSCADVDISICWNNSGEETSLHMVKKKAENSEGAFYMVDLGLIASHYHRWIRLLPRVRPFFAIKCNPDDMVIGMLMALGAGFDCASEGEVNVVRGHMERFLAQQNAAGDALRREWIANNIIYANPIKMRSHMRNAHECGVQWTTFDSIIELKKVAREWPDAKLVLRIVPPRVFKAVVQFEGKFGACTNEIPTLLAAAKQLSLDVVGVSFHVGSGCNEAEAWSETIIYARKVFEMMRHFGYAPYLLDLGGGFHGVTAFPTAETLETVAAFERACVLINSTIDRYFPEDEGYTIIAEPGRYFVEAGYTLATKVIGKHSIRSTPMTLEDAWSQCRFTDDDELALAMEREMTAEAFEDDEEAERRDGSKGAPRVRYYLDDSVYASFNCNIFDVAIEPLCYFRADAETGELTRVEASAPRFPSKMYGATCDSADCIRKSCDLPALSEGDWIVWRDAGAYTMSAGCPFNGIPLPPLSYYVCSDQLDLLPEIASAISLLHGHEVVLSSGSESGGSRGADSDSEEISGVLAAEQDAVFSKAVAIVEASAGGPSEKVPSVSCAAEESVGVLHVSRGDCLNVVQKVNRWSIQL